MFSNTYQGEHMKLIIVGLMLFLLSGCGVAPEGQTDTAVVGEEWALKGLWVLDSPSCVNPPQSIYGGYGVLLSSWNFQTENQINLLFPGMETIRWRIDGTNLQGDHSITYAFQVNADKTITITYGPLCSAQYRKGN